MVLMKDDLGGNRGLSDIFRKDDRDDLSRSGSADFYQGMKGMDMITLNQSIPSFTVNETQPSITQL